MRIQKLQLSEVGPFQGLDLTFPKCGDKEHAEVHIFTGPNGCGKTTLLYALAAAFDFDYELERRFWLNGTHPHLRAILDHPKSSDESASQGTNQVYLGIPDEAMRKTVTSEDIMKFQRRNETNLFRIPVIDRFSQLFKHQRRRNSNPEPDTDWAAFSYAGRYATLPEPYIQGLEELEIGPLQGALDFQQKPEELLKWIALTASKAAIEQSNGNFQQAERFRKPIRQLERALEIMLEEDVKIKLQTSPFIVALLVNGRSLEVGILPDGIKSFLGWLGDLVSRLDRVKWEKPGDILSQNFILFLDEIAIHMHPSWQRKVLRVVQQLFPNAQIFCSTHSPFVVNSVDNATVHQFRIQNGLSILVDSTTTSEGVSVDRVLRYTFDIDARFGKTVEDQLDQFSKLRDDILQGDHGKLDALTALAASLVETGPEIKQIVAFEINQLSRILQQDITL
ncbi:AAA family ATPase [Acanthopleuribacter pedis]|uniref:AAA family ATPase n=1 Tax=Acanthopleuribacter pedis TaxID=442870 RepID=A0A8J7QAX4_9BACT|nr:ATP-binding protein [Acanthopleuribacter pedis]MBO1321087.1 AAA family ATPase [Acanthopleuribacter pedis]